MNCLELARWTRFAAKGGIGKCTAVHDCVAQSPDDLMFLKDDEIVVLMQLQERPDTYLGYCEDVVGKFEGSFVKFHGPLKRPVLTKRVSDRRAPSPTHFRPPSNSPRPTSSPVPEFRSGGGSPPPNSLASSSSSSETTHPETISPSTEEDTESHTHDLDDEPLAAPSLISHSSASSAMGSAPATPADFDSSHHTQNGRSEPHLSPSSPENPTFDDTKDLDLSFVPSEPSTRISMATIDGTEGIGLSLLQSFMGSSGEDDSDASSDTDMPGYARQASPDSSVDGHCLDYDSTPSQSVDGHRPTPQPESASTSPVTRRSRDSRASSHRSEYSDQGEEWEGASDIYDNYRYSRFSIASKVSRLSRGSMKAPPPIPLSDQRPGFEPEVIAKRPAPLDLEARSPLLHTTFGSPLHSPGERTSASTASTLPSTAGVATTIRYRLESERDPEIPTTSGTQLTPAREGEIVISDDEEGPEVAPPNDSSRSSSPTDVGDETFDSTASSQSTGDESVATDETLLTTQPLLETQPLRLYRTPALPTQQETHPAPPAEPPTIAQPRPSKPAAFDFGSSRTSMFLPHPGAPKAPETAPLGPLYGRIQSPPSAPSVKHTQTSLFQVLHAAATTQTYPNGAPRKMTVYGRCEAELESAPGPVQITFSLEPPISVPANRIVPHRSQSSDSGPTPPSSQPSTPTNKSFPGSRPNTSPRSPGNGQNSGSIPRPNFFPQTPQTRPRSRSFSGFGATSQASPSPRPSEGNTKQQNPQNGRSQPKAESDEPPRPISSRRPNTMGRAVHKPSPLSLPQNNVSSDPSAGLTVERPKLPLSASVTSFPSPTSPISFNSLSPGSSPALSVPMVLRQAVSSIQLRTPGESPTSMTLPNSPPPPSRGAGATGDQPLPRPAEAVHSSIPLDAPRPSTSSSESSGKQGVADVITLKSSNRRSSFDTDASRTSDNRSTSVISPSLRSVSPPPGPTRSTSLRSKISKTAILAKTSGLETLGGIQPPTSLTLGTETVQVEDMDFELIKPSFPRALSPRSSLDSSSSQQPENDHQASPVNFLRAESPSSFLSSGVSERDGASANRRPSPSSIAQSEVLSPSDVEAHRNRELKWISLMSTLDPAQTRKSKKAKKLLLSGVPASVRYQVWAHLADCQGKRMNGLYPQLVRRGAVPATPAIIRDSADRFGDQPQGKDGSIISVLQAYLTMVPDVQYHIALTCIVGQLLAQSPEEDAFWIFISMMDSYLRPYFSSNVALLDFDAILFAKALEANDAPLAKRILVDMSIPPLAICRQWFCSLFYDTIPPEYHLRVWDVFLFEGVPFLFRVGLALLTCCRRPLLEAQSRDRALYILSQVPAHCLPSNGDALIELAMSKKLRDDDIRKARSKAETQKKRSTSTRFLKSSASPGTPISLPR